MAENDSRPYLRRAANRPELGRALPGQKSKTGGQRRNAGDGADGIESDERAQRERPGSKQFHDILPD